MKKHPLIELELRSHAWAMTGEALDAMLSAVENGHIDASEEPKFHAARGEMPRIKSASGRYRYGEQSGNVGVLRVEGPICPRATWITEASGLTSCDALASDLSAMEADPSIEKIAMVYDSPGGAVTGVSELAAQIRACSKPTSSYVFGLGASAAYWLASAADEIVCADTALVGSIGTVMHLGKSDGSKVKIVSSQSPKKQADPETEDGREEYQALVDELADVFVDTVAENRGTTRDDVLENFGRGGMMGAPRAIAAGMVDRSSTFAEFMESLSKPMASFGGAAKRARQRKRAMSVDNSSTDAVLSDCQGEAVANKGENEMTLNELLASNPAAKAEFDQALAAATAEAKEKATADARASMKEAAKFAADANYPQAVRTVAADVIDGKSSMETLKAVVAYADMDAERKNSEAAKALTNEIGTTPAQPKIAGSTDGVIRTQDDLVAALAMRG